MICFLRHVVAIALPFTLLIFLTGLWTDNFAAVVEYGFEKNEWLTFNVASISGLALVYVFNTLANAPRPCKWTPFRSARGIHGLGNSFHKFLSMMLIVCFLFTQENWYMNMDLFQKECSSSKPQKLGGSKCEFSGV